MESEVDRDLRIGDWTLALEDAEKALRDAGYGATMTVADIVAMAKLMQEGD